MHEYFLPFLCIALFIGYEIGFYLIYQYIKIRKEKIAINRIILAYGLFSAFGMSGVFIRTISFYYEESILFYFLLYKISHVLIAFGVIIFLIIISNKSFNKIVNVKYTKAVLSLAIIFSIIITFTIPDIIERILIFLSIFIGIIYLTYAHIKIIKHIPDNAKNRIILIYIGFCVLIFAILLRAEESLIYFQVEIQNLIELITIPIMIFSLLIVLFGAYRFPILLEIHWQDKILQILIIDSKINEILYSYTYKKKNISEEKTPSQQLKDLDKIITISVNIPDIEDFVSKFVNKHENIEKITHGDHYIYISHGNYKLSHILFLIIAQKDLNSIKYFLEFIKIHFQRSYKNIIVNKNLTFINKKDIILGFSKIIEKFLNRGVDK
ncbi:MAG: hypothetical protein JXA99_03405 [Candidatus Lokiarchaeota archaeon]|nr:hypothetical protein [Candidatus Lokiarchaeota archaeon]